MSGLIVDVALLVRQLSDFLSRLHADRAGVVLDSFVGVDGDVFGGAIANPRTNAISVRMCAALDLPHDGTIEQLEAAAEELVARLDERNKLVPEVEKLRSLLRAMWVAIGRPHPDVGLTAYDATIAAANDVRRILGADESQTTAEAAKEAIDTGAFYKKKSRDAAIELMACMGIDRDVAIHGGLEVAVNYVVSHATRPVPPVPSPHHLSRELCDRVLNSERHRPDLGDDPFPVVVGWTSTERYLAQTLLAVLGPDGPRDVGAEPEPLDTIPSLRAELSYEALLVQLHELARAGALESEEADLVRAQMDEPWARLGRFERERISRLSAALRGSQANNDADIELAITKITLERKAHHDTQVKLDALMAALHEVWVEVGESRSAHGGVYADLMFAVRLLKADVDHANRRHRYSASVEDKSPRHASQTILHIAIASLITVMSTDPRDWSDDPTDTWMYGVIVGWTPAELAEVVEKHDLAESAAAVMSAANQAVTEFLRSSP